MRILGNLFNSTTKTDNLTVGYALEMLFPAGPLRINTTASDVTFGGNTFIAAGDTATVSGINEQATLTAANLSIRLSGLNNAAVAAAIDDLNTNNPQGKLCAVYMYLMDTNHALIGQPYRVGKWRMDTMHFTSGATASIALTGTSVLADWKMLHTRYYTDSDQKSRFTTDTFFDLMVINQDVQVTWGVV